MSSRLGDILVKDSLISADQLKQALDYQKKNGGRLGTCLVKMGLVSDDDITAVLSRQYGVPSINLKFYEVDPTVIKLVPQETAIRYQIVPLSRVGSTLTIAMTDPTNVFAMDDIKFMTGFNVEPVVASETAIGEAIHKFYGDVDSVEELDKVMKDLTGEDADALELASEEAEMDLASLERAAEEAPIIKLCNLILTDAVKRGASDIHVEPYEKEFRVRFRIDGVLQNVMAPPLKLKDAMTSRIKIMSKLDISEKRLPQDGRIMIKYLKDGKKKELDFRVSTVPTLFGEKIVLRLLDKENLRLDMTKLGFEAESLKKFEYNILKPYGMVLVTSPTGSGKTNTLYSSVARFNHSRHEHHDRRRSRRIPAAGHQPGADEGADWAELRFGPARLFAARPQHHSGRRNPRLRNGGNCGQGGAHRPLGAFDAAHQRCAVHHQPADEHGHRAFPGGHFREPDLRAAVGSAHLRAMQRTDAVATTGIDRLRLHARRGRKNHRAAREGMSHVQQHGL